MVNSTNLIEQKQKCSLTALAGIPNAGKSTLLNHLVGNKVSIVTPKIQTTRTVINGIFTENDTQLIFLDTPGLFTPNSKLEKSMVKTAWKGIRGADFIALLIDSSKGLNDQIKEILRNLAHKKITPLIILNKIDLVAEEKVKSLQQEIRIIHPDMIIFHISAKKGVGVDKFKEYLIKHAPFSPWLYPQDEVTTAPLSFLSSEITREQLFLLLQQELPYQLTVETEHIEYNKDGSIKISQVVYLTKSSHKKIVLGEKGSKIKQIGIKARFELEKILENKIHLFLHVKVRKDWDSDPSIYKYMNMQLP